MNAKVGWIFIEYNGVLVIRGNSKKLPMNIMLIPPNGNILDFSLYDFRCIITSMLQPNIEISSIITNQ